MHSFAAGFVLIARGQRLTAGGVIAFAAAAGLGFIYLLSLWGAPGADERAKVGTIVFGGAAGLAGVVAVVGVVMSFVGRCKLLACPPELPRLRAAAKLAVVFEACAWLHLISAAAVVIGTEQGWFLLPAWVGLAGIGLALLLLVAGRSFHLVYCFRLGRLIGEPTTATASAFRGGVMMMLALMGWACGWSTISSGCGLLVWVVAAVLSGGIGFHSASTASRLAAACRRHTFTVDDS